MIGVDGIETLDHWPAFGCYCRPLPSQVKGSCAGTVKSRRCAVHTITSRPLPSRSIPVGPVGGWDRAASVGRDGICASGVLVN
jgi:hypothetical protein